jgi:hypothetical protein
MITAARLIAHKSINGVYQSTLQLDKFPVIGHQMTHSMDSFMTDSANSATSLYTGHKTTVNSLGVYVDSSPDLFDDPKIESIFEIFQRVRKGAVGLVSTALAADATPAAATAVSFPVLIRSILVILLTRRNSIPGIVVSTASALTLSSTASPTTRGRRGPVPTSSLAVVQSISTTNPWEVRATRTETTMPSLPRRGIVWRRTKTSSASSPTAAKLSASSRSPTWRNGLTAMCTRPT